MDERLLEALLHAPAELRTGSLLRDATTPGPPGQASEGEGEGEGGDVDYLFTTPPRLLQAIEARLRSARGVLGKDEARRAMALLPVLSAGRPGGGPSVSPIWI